MNTCFERIIKMRNVWRLSLEDVAQQLGISVLDYANLENGKVIPDMNIAMKLCEIFKITLDYLMTGVESKKDLDAINRPLTKEEKITDKLEEIKKLYSKNIFDKYYDYLYAIYIDGFGSKLKNKIFDQNHRINFTNMILLDDFEFLNQLAKNIGFDLHYTKQNHREHTCSHNIDELLDYKQILKLLQIDDITDQGFVDYAIEKNPVKTLNYYLLDKKLDDKKTILSCLNKGGYVEKVIDIKYHYDDEYGTTTKEYEFGKDSLATMLLKQYCLTK